MRSRDVDYLAQALCTSFIHIMAAVLLVGAIAGLSTACTKEGDPRRAAGASGSAQEAASTAAGAAAVVEAYTHFASKNWAAAEAVLAKALVARPQDPLLLNDHAVVLALLGRRDEAVAALRAGLRQANSVMVERMGSVLVVNSPTREDKGHLALVHYAFAPGSYPGKRVDAASSASPNPPSTVQLKDVVQANLAKLEEPTREQARGAGGMR
jgi:hypothetical protein